MSDPIRVSVIGAGQWGPNLIRNFRQDLDAWLVHVCDASEERRRLISRAYPNIGVVPDAEAVLRDPEGASREPRARSCGPCSPKGSSRELRP